MKLTKPSNLIKLAGKVKSEWGFKGKVYIRQATTFDLFLEEIENSCFHLVFLAQSVHVCLSDGIG
jgi:hypothetical protein